MLADGVNPGIGDGVADAGLCILLNSALSLDSFRFHKSDTAFQIPALMDKSVFWQPSTMAQAVLWTD